MEEIVKIIHNNENVYSSIFNLMGNAKSVLDMYVDPNNSILLSNNDLFLKYLNNLKRNGVEIRCIVDSSIIDTQYIHKLLEIIPNLKHFKGINGLVMISNSEYLQVDSNDIEVRKYNTTYSNDSKIITIVKRSFDMLFKSSNSVNDFIFQSINYNTEPLPNFLRFRIKNDISDQISFFISDSKFLCIFSSIKGMLFGCQNYFSAFDDVLEKKKRGEHDGVRWITTIRNKSDLNLIKSIKSKGIKIRHVNNPPPFDFAVSQQYFASTIEKMEDGKLVIDNFMLNDDKANLSFFSMVFNKMWESGVDADERIREIEEGIVENMEIIHDSNDALVRISELSLHAKSEILIVLPSVNGFYRVELAGGFRSLNELGVKGIKIKILTLIDSSSDKESNNIKSKYSHILFKDLILDLPSDQRIIIFDRKTVIIWNVKDDSQIKFSEALGTASFIDNDEISKAFASIFDGLWYQSEIYNNLKNSHNALKEHDRVQTQFVDLVAHELRTPIQSVMGLTELLKENIGIQNQKAMLNIAVSNAKKLNRLSENVLDLIQLDQDTLRLNPTIFNINQLITDVTKTEIDFQNPLSYGKSVEFIYKNFETNKIVFADKNRIGQVCSNLIDNSIKSINHTKGIIVIKLCEKRIHKRTYVVVEISDNGFGLNREKLSRPFSRFSSDSYYGLGLGLHLSKRIIEKHGGRIWVLNNKDSSGCTFSFAVPKYESH